MQPPRETHVERSPKRQRSFSSSSSKESGQSRQGIFHRSRSKRSPVLQNREVEEGEPHTRRRGGSPTSKKTSRSMSRRRRRSPSPPQQRGTNHDHRTRRRSPSPSPRRRRTPSPSDSPSESDESTASSRSRRGHCRVRRTKHPAWKHSRKITKFREGGKNVTFVTYDGTYGETDKVLAFIQ